MINDIKTLKALLSKRRFAYETLQNNRVSDETTFSAHKSSKKVSSSGSQILDFVLFLLAGTGASQTSGASIVFNHYHNLNMKKKLGIYVENNKKKGNVALDILFYF